MNDYRPRSYREIIVGLRDAAPPSEVKVYSITTGRLLRTEPGQQQYDGIYANKTSKREKIHA